MRSSATAKQGRTRKLRNGSTVPELDVPVNLTITTSSPAKWAFVDLETGSVWVDPEARAYREASTEIRQAVSAAAAAIR